MLIKTNLKFVQRSKICALITNKMKLNINTLVVVFQLCFPERDMEDATDKVKSKPWEA